MPHVATTASTTIRAPRPAVFDGFVDVELPRILQGYGPLPGVARTSGQAGAWDRVGSRRTVHLTDGHTAREEVIACDRPRLFAYRVTGYTNAFRFFARSAEGQWRFAEANGSTAVAWTYTFRARSWPAVFALLPVVKLLLRGYMHAVLHNVKALAEAEAV